MLTLRVLLLGDEVVEAVAPSTLSRLEAHVRDDLRVILTIIKHAETMASLMTFRGARLTRLSGSRASDFHYGTDSTGVVLHPIDDQGARLAVDQSKVGAVVAVAILAVGLSLKEATSR